jgi:hypothetical protein
MLALLAVLGALQLQSAPPPGTIAGQVVEAVSGRPVGAVAVTITSAPGTPAVSSDANLHGRAAVLTATDGRFFFGDLPPGSYVVNATRGGYADGASGRRRPGGSSQPVALTPGARSADVVIRLWKYGAITGTVTDEAGEPVVGLQVVVLSRTKPGAPAPAGGAPGFVALQRAYATAGAPVLTDDRGVYRVGSLPDGDYLVVTSPPLVSATRNTITDLAETGRGTGQMLALVGGSAFAVTGREVAQTAAPLQIGDTIVSAGRGRAPVLPAGPGHIRVYPPTFYPSALVPAQAATVTVSGGAERAGIDIALAPVAAARVAGTLFDRDGPAAIVPLRLVPAGAEGVVPDLVAPASITDATGAFVFAGVPAGQYRLHAVSLGLNGVDAPVSVAGDDIDGLTVTATPLPAITVSLQFDGTGPPPFAPPGRGPLRMPALLLDPVDGAFGAEQLMTRPSSDEKGYIVNGYPPGRYRVRMINSPLGWMFKAAMLNGVDVSETPFDLTKDVPDLTLVFTDRWTGISGVVQGESAGTATVVAFPTATAQWSGDSLAPRRFKTARANERGEFGMSSLPPGDYFVVAVPEEQTDDWRNPATLDALGRVAVQITILDGEHRTIALPLREIRQ